MARRILIAALIGVGLTLPAAAGEADNAIMFQACAKVEREQGRHDRAETFERAARAIAGGQPIPAPSVAPQWFPCSGLYPMTRIYLTGSEDRGRG